MKTDVITDISLLECLGSGRVCVGLFHRVGEYSCVLWSGEGFATCERSLFLHPLFLMRCQSLEFGGEMRILAEMKIENRGKKNFRGKQQAYFFFFFKRACQCRQIQVHKTDILHIFYCAKFLQICLQNVSNCTDFSLDFKHYLGVGGGKGGMPPDPPRNFLLFFFFY